MGYNISLFYLSPFSSMRLSLNVLERTLLFGLINVHPRFQQSSALNFRMREAALHVLSLEEHDKEFYGIREVVEPEGKTMIYFDNKELCARDLSYTLPDPLMNDVFSLLRELDKESKLTPDQFKLWMKVMPADEKKKLEESFDNEEFKRVEPEAAPAA